MSPQPSTPSLCPCEHRVTSSVIAYKLARQYTQQSGRLNVLFPVEYLRTQIGSLSSRAFTIAALAPIDESRGFDWS